MDIRNYFAQVVARFKALSTAQKATLLAALPVLVLVFFGGVSLGSDGPTPSIQPAQTVVETSAAYDPYTYYLEHNPDPSLVLSAQDAATRALLGCSYSDEMVNSFPVDKVLREAYGPTGICG